MNWVAVRIGRCILAYPLAALVAACGLVLAILTVIGYAAWWLISIAGRGFDAIANILYAAAWRIKLGSWHVHQLNAAARTRARRIVWAAW